mmetsp:Transcript_27886/g.47709  ORF Transcript_27886/g.47709 Transcript_27886/m.47709 type:complete len:800 (+) Transcript_27886:45-2444(+)
MSFPYRNFGNPNSYGSQGQASNTRNTGQSDPSPADLQELLALQRQIQQGVNPSNRPPPSYNQTAPPLTGPYLEKYLKQAQSILSQMPNYQSQPTRDQGLPNHYNPPPAGPPYAGGRYGASNPPPQQPPSQFQSYSNVPPNSGPPNPGYYSHPNPGPAYNPPPHNPPYQFNQGNNPSSYNQSTGSGNNNNNSKNQRNIGKDSRQFNRKNDRGRDNNYRRDDKSRRQTRNTKSYGKDSNNKQMNRQRTPPRNTKRQSSPKRSRTEQPSSKSKSSGEFRYIHSLKNTHVDYLEIRQRHHRMVIPKDFSTVKFHCLNDSFMKNGSIPDIDNYYLNFDCSSVEDNSSTIDKTIDPSHEISNIANNSCFYSSKVLLYTGQNIEKDYHSSNSYRFIVGRRGRSELFCIGGSWSAELDGGDPSTDSSILTKTATRYCKEFCGLDLSECKFIPFLEINYKRPQGKETCMIFIPTLWDLSEETIINQLKQVNEDRKTTSVGGDTDDFIAVPSSDQQDEDISETDDELNGSPILPQPFVDKKEENILESDKAVDSDKMKDDTNKLNEDKMEVEKETKKVNELHLITRVPKNIRIKPLGLSLNGLLEYDDKDKDENTFEVSLCGEFFQDMLKKQFGDVIRKALEKYRDSKSIDSSEPPAKKQKIEVDSDVTTGRNDDDNDNDKSVEKEDQKKEGEEDNLDGEEIMEGEDIQETEDKKEVSEEEKEDKKEEHEEKEEPKKTELNLLLLDAFSFFDIKDSGYFYPEEIEDIIYSLGEDLPMREVEGLVDTLNEFILDNGKIWYKKLVSDGILV